MTRRGDPFSVFLFTNNDGSLRGWYVNLERPQHRTAIGFDYEDDLLDVWVALGAEPDSSTRTSSQKPSNAASSLPSGPRNQSRRGALLAEPPWPTGWEEWRPEPGWQVPVLPPGWEQLSP